MEIKISNINNLNKILEVYQHARLEMKKNGNPNQWADSKPEEKDVIKDINDGYHFSIWNIGEIIGVFSLINEEKTYSYILGAWPNNNKYKTIHKIASLNKEKGILLEAVKYALNLIDTIRIDTHSDNKIMQHLLAKYGFKYCGIIYLENGDERLAYQLDKKDFKIA